VGEFFTMQAEVFSLLDFLHNIQSITIPDWHRHRLWSQKQAEDWLASLSVTNYAGTIYVSNSATANYFLADGYNRLLLLSFLVQISFGSQEGYIYLFSSGSVPKLDPENRYGALKLMGRQSTSGMDMLYQSVAHTRIDPREITLTVITLTPQEANAIYLQENSPTFTLQDTLQTRGLSRDTAHRIPEEAFITAFVQHKTRKVQVAPYEFTYDDWEVQRYLDFYKDFWLTSDLPKLEAKHWLPLIFELCTGYDTQKFDKETLLSKIDEVTRYEVRRQLGKINFAPTQIIRYTIDKPLSAVWQGKDLAEDELTDMVIKSHIYTDSAKLTKYLLESYEDSFGKDKKDLSALTIEHVMPQTREPHWTDIPKVQHRNWVHTIGNLTLTAWNSELSNRPFSEKKEMYEPLYLNQDIVSQSRWTTKTIKERGEHFAKWVWEYYGPPQEQQQEELPKITGCKYNGEHITTRNWQELEYKIYQRLSERYPSLWIHLDEEIPEYFAADKKKFKNPEYIYEIYYEKSFVMQRLEKVLDYVPDGALEIFVKKEN
jgi:hypothetical protein